MTGTTDSPEPLKREAIMGATSALLSAREAGLVACQSCGQVHPLSAAHCTRCKHRLRSRDAKSLQKVWAWLVAGMVMYLPANIYPMLLTSTLVKRSESTIIGGVVELVEHGSLGIAAVVFGASVLIPLGKFIAIIYLAISVQQGSSVNRHKRYQAYEIVEFIGRWSMIDVFVVAILCALVQLDAIATINPGIAAVSFALSVIFTMLSAQAFDSRLIWDANRIQHE